jgi:hypothetical protein
LKKEKKQYFLVILLVIFLGLFSRETTKIPLFIGDLLYAVMIYFIIRIIFTTIKRKQSAITALLICYCIEFFQIYQTNWIIPIRKILIGKLVLGQFFLWNDLLAYSFGIGIAYIIDTLFFKTELK